MSSVIGSLGFPSKNALGTSNAFPTQRSPMHIGGNKSLSQSDRNFAVGEHFPSHHDSFRYSTINSGRPESLAFTTRGCDRGFLRCFYGRKMNIKCLNTQTEASPKRKTSEDRCTAVDNYFNTADDRPIPQETSTHSDVVVSPEGVVHKPIIMARTLGCAAIQPETCACAWSSLGVGALPVFRICAATW